MCDARLNSNNNAVLWTEKGPLVIDCGGTMPYELISLNLPFEAIAGILLTHVVISIIILYRFMVIMLMELNM